MDTLMSIKTFRQIIESGSFVAAAERLDMSTAMVSKHVMHIEKRLGVRLLNRNPRTLSLTEHGAVYLERCKVLLDGLHETEVELGSLSAAPRGTLRISAPTWFAEQLADMLASFRQRYPQIVVDIAFEDRICDLLQEGYDLALRATAGALPMGLVARRLQPRQVSDRRVARVSQTPSSANLPGGSRQSRLRGRGQHGFLDVHGSQRKARSSGSSRTALPHDVWRGERRRCRHRSRAAPEHALRGACVQGHLDAGYSRNILFGRGRSISSMRAASTCRSRSARSSTTSSSPFPCIRTGHSRGRSRHSHRTPTVC